MKFLPVKHLSYSWDVTAEKYANQPVSIHRHMI